MIYILIILIIATLLLVIRAFRKQIIKWLLALRAKLQIHSLRQAIDEADKDKEETKRKNMVVFNTVGGKFEPIQKKTLKRAASAGKNKSNKKMTDGRKKMLKKKPRVITMQRVKKIEEDALYITK